MSWRPKNFHTIRTEWLSKNAYFGCSIENKAIFEAGADAMHKEDIEWLIQRITHDDRGYVFNMNDKEWQEFIDV